MAARTRVSLTGNGSFRNPNGLRVPHGLDGEYVRTKGVWHRKIREEISIEGLDLEDAINSLREVAEGLDKPYISRDYGYDSYDKLFITGTRAATDEEGIWIKKQIAWETDEQKARNEQERERLLARLKALDEEK